MVRLMVVDVREDDRRGKRRKLPNLTACDHGLWSKMHGYKIMMMRTKACNERLPGRQDKLCIVLEG